MEMSTNLSRRFILQNKFFKTQTIPYKQELLYAWMKTENYVFGAVL